MFAEVGVCVSIDSGELTAGSAVGCSVGFIGSIGVLGSLEGFRIAFVGLAVPARPVAFLVGLLLCDAGVIFLPGADVGRFIAGDWMDAPSILFTLLDGATMLDGLTPSVELVDGWARCVGCVTGVPGVPPAGPRVPVPAPDRGIGLPVLLVGCIRETEDVVGLENDGAVATVGRLAGGFSLREDIVLCFGSKECSASYHPVSSILGR